MLNVSLHNPKLKERDRMTRQGFLSMLRGCDNGADLPPDLLDSIFASIEADGIMVCPAKKKMQVRSEAFLRLTYFFFLSSFRPVTTDQTCGEICLLPRKSVDGY